MRKPVRVRLRDTPNLRDPLFPTYFQLFSNLDDEACRVRFRFRMRSKLVQDDSFARSNVVMQLFVSCAVRQASEHDRRWFAVRTEPVPARNRFGTSFLRFFGPSPPARAARSRHPRSTPTGLLGAITTSSASRFPPGRSWPTIRSRKVRKSLRREVVQFFRKIRVHLQPSSS